uniref:HTH psq-type domain-containing protein n=2 Tax=Denticeps clupeoides TaxID=299321 RepID=A0AAY4A8F5_9TELE
MQRMIRQFAAEYTSKTSSTQDKSQPPPQPNGTKDQSLPKAPSLGLDPSCTTGTNAAASAQNPVLSKLLMADQDSPLDLTVKKAEAELSDQDGVLDLSTKKNYGLSGGTFKRSHGFSVTPVLKGRSLRADHHFRDPDDEDSLPPRSLQDGRSWENYVGSTPLKPPLARSLLIKEELLNQKHRLLSQPPLSLAGLESAGILNHTQPHQLLSREAAWPKPHLDNLLKLKQANSTIGERKELPLYLENHTGFAKGTANSHAKAQESPCAVVKKESGLSPPVDLKIPQVRGMDLSWETHSANTDLYGYGSIALGGVHSDNALSRKLRAILPKQSRRAGLGGLLDGAAVSEYWSSDVDQSTSGPQYPTSDPEGDANGSKQPRKKRGRYRQYNSEILEEAIAVVMGGKMSVSKAQNIYGIPHSTLEYKVKERMGTLKNPPKKKLKLMMRMEGQESGVTADAENTPTPTSTPIAPEETSQGGTDIKDE